MKRKKGKKKENDRSSFQRRVKTAVSSEGSEE
jgi:hypothetical protein